MMKRRKAAGVECELFYSGTPVTKHAMVQDYLLEKTQRSETMKRGDIPGIAAMVLAPLAALHAVGVKPPVQWPLPDAARVLQFVRSKAAEWNIDETRIGASGCSPGAGASLWLAFHPDFADAQVIEKAAPNLIRRKPQPVE
jgi:hypothetical protein